MMRGLLVFLATASGAIAISGASGSTRDPRVWQADVKIESLDAGELRSGGPVNARIVIAVDGGESARAVRVEILLPIGVGVLRIPDACRPSPSPVTGLNGRVTCDVGEIPGRSTREILLSTSARVSPQPIRFAAFVYSDTPDPAPSNNFAEKSVQ